MPAIVLFRRMMSAMAGLAYDVRDLFSSSYAAGTLDNSAADPGPGTRDVVTDGNSKLSIASGVLNFATGGVGNGDPGVWYKGVARTSGKMFIASIDGISVTNQNLLSAGWDGNQSGAATESIVMIATANLSVLVNGSLVAVGVFAASAPYQVAVILRGTGGWHFIKGGTFTYWTLLYVGAAGTTSPMYPNIGARGTASVFTADNVRVPTAVYIPAPLVYDTFTRANGALGTSETTGPDSQVITGSSWTGSTFAIATNVAVGTPALGSEVIVNGAMDADTDWTKGAGWAIAAGVATTTAATSNLDAAVDPLTIGTWYQTAYTMAGFTAGTAKIVLGGVSFPTHGSNATFTETGRAGTAAFTITAAGATYTIDNVTAKPLTLSELFASLSTSTQDVIIDVAVTLSGAAGGLQAGLVLNLDSAATPANFVIAYLDGNGNCKLDKCVAGTYTAVLTGAVTYSAGAVLRVTKRGTGYRLYYNNAAVGALGTISDAGIVDNVLCGLFSTSASNSLDNFTVWASGLENEYAALDVYV